METDRSSRRWPLIAYAVGTLLVLASPLAGGVSASIEGIATGLSAIFGGMTLSKGLRDGAIASRVGEVAGHPSPGWLIGRAASVNRAILLWEASAAAMYGIGLIVDSRTPGRVFGVVATLTFIGLLFTTWMDARRGWDPQLFLTPEGFSAYRAGRLAFAPWPSIEEARANSFGPDRASTVNVCFSDPAVARAMRRTRRFVPLLRSQRWHLSWNVFGTGIRGGRLADALMNCARDETSRAAIGTESGLVTLGLVDS